VSLKSVTLWRAADDDIIVGTASFSPDRACAEAYLDNPPFGGSRLWRADIVVDKGKVLDLNEHGRKKLRKLGIDYGPGAELEFVVAHEAEALSDAGYIWVRHPETYPPDCEDTWTFVGSSDDEPQLVEVDVQRNPRRFSEVVAQVKAARADFLRRSRAQFERKRIVAVESYDLPFHVSTLTRGSRPSIAAYQVTDFEDGEPVAVREYATLEHALEALWEVASRHEQGLPERDDNPRSVTLARRLRNP